MARKQFTLSSLHRKIKIRSFILTDKAEGIEISHLQLPGRISDNF
ncbi:hypothetical protein SAMN05428947_101745 [Mucilaginibacter sp. OK283]|jgi:hypothetical protein|nr:hypothetical protein SAMN05428947_101745 [Mucilaginibacter sp. OK283]